MKFITFTIMKNSILYRLMQKYTFLMLIKINNFDIFINQAAIDLKCTKVFEGVLNFF